MGDNLEYDLSPFVLEELNKVVKDDDFYQNSLEIYSNLIHTQEFETGNHGHTLSDFTNNHQNLDQSDVSVYNDDGTTSNLNFKQAVGSGTVMQQTEGGSDKFPRDNCLFSLVKNEREKTGDATLGEMEVDQGVNQPLSTQVGVQSPNNDQEKTMDKVQPDVSIDTQSNKRRVRATRLIQNSEPLVNSNLRPKIQNEAESDEISKIHVINSHNLKRNDVVVKSILRLMKRYYRTKFTELPEFKKFSGNPTASSNTIKKPVKNVVTYIDFMNLNSEGTLLVEWALKVVSDLGVLPRSENMEFYVLAVAFPTETLKILQDIKPKTKVCQTLSKQGISMAKLIDNAMNRFSKKIFKSFIETPEISLLIQQFLNSNQDYLSRIDGFGAYVKSMDDKSKQVIKSHYGSLD